MIKQFAERSDRALETNPDISGIEKCLYQLVLADVFNKQANKEIVNPSTYNYFSYYPRKSNSRYYIDQAFELCKEIIKDDPMGAEIRFVDIFGLTINDLLEVDFLTLKELERICRNLAREHLEDLKKRKTEAENAAKQLRNRERKNGRNQ